MEVMILRLYLETIGIIVVSIVYLIYLKKKKRWLQWEKLAPDMQEVVKRNEKKINVFLKILVGFAIAILWMWIAIPAIKDFPNVMSDKYIEAEGNVIYWDYSDENKTEMRSIAIIDSNTNKKISVRVYSKGIREGEYLKVMYLPNSEYGVIEERK